MVSEISEAEVPFKEQLHNIITQRQTKTTKHKGTCQFVTLTTLMKV